MSDTISSDSVAQDQLRAFIERIERMEEEKKAIADDIKEIYAEAKGNGFDTKVLRQIIRIRKIDLTERMEQEALLALYMDALGMAVAPRQDDDYDDEPPRGGSRQPEYRADATGLRQIGSVASGIVANLNTNPAVAASNSNADAPIPSGAAKEVSPDASFAPIQPEPTTANSPVVGPDDQSTAALKDSAEQGADTEEGQRSGYQAPPVDTPSLTGSAADKSASSGVSPALAAPTDHIADAGTKVSPAPTKLKMNAEFFEKPHPQCQRPGFCGGNSALALCDACKAAAGIVAQSDVEAEHVVH